MNRTVYMYRPEMKPLCINTDSASTPGDILEFQNTYYIITDDLDIKLLSRYDDRFYGKFNIEFDVTKNITDFRTKFRDILKSWRYTPTITSIAIRPDDSFILEQFGKAFDQSVMITFRNEKYAMLEFQRVVDTIECTNIYSEQIISCIRIPCHYDMEHVFYMHNLRISNNYKNDLLYTLILKRLYPCNELYMKNIDNVDNMYNSKTAFFYSKNIPA